MPSLVSTLLSSIGAVAGGAVRMTAAGMLAAFSPSVAGDVTNRPSARALPEAEANSIMAAPGRMERPATT